MRSKRSLIPRAVTKYRKNNNRADIGSYFLTTPKNCTVLRRDAGTSKKRHYPLAGRQLILFSEDDRDRFIVAHSAMDGAKAVSYPVPYKQGEGVSAMCGRWVAWNSCMPG